MINLKFTWTDVEQPNDQDIAGNETFRYKDYQHFNKGLQILANNIRGLRQIASKLELNQSLYENDLARIENMISWGKDKLTEQRVSAGSISDGQISFETLRYLKAGLLALILEKIKQNSQQQFPERISNAFEKEINDLIELSEHKKLKVLKPADIFFEIYDTNEYKPFWVDNSSTLFRDETESIQTTKQHLDQQDELESLLEIGESATLEIKGSLTVDIKRLLEGDGKCVNSKEIAEKGVLKTIVAFLNTKGGNIVIGALENTHFPAIPEKFKIDFKEFKGYWLPGIEIEKQDSDKFQLKLRDFIHNHIAGDLIDVIEVRFASFRDKTLCLVTVRANSGRWHYLNKTEFYVRDGNRTKLLQGEDADRYKERNRKPFS